MPTTRKPHLDALAIDVRLTVKDDVCSFVEESEPKMVF